MAKKNLGGRPLKEIDKVQFENLCGLQCTKSEICSWFDVTDKTLENWCKRTYIDESGKPLGFSDIFAIKRGIGKISLRRAQFRLAEKNANMAIFLGKQYLEQADNAGLNVKLEEVEDDPLTKALKEEAKKMDKNPEV